MNVLLFDDQPSFLERLAARVKDEVAGVNVCCIQYKDESGAIRSAESIARDALTAMNQNPAFTFLVVDMAADQGGRKQFGALVSDALARILVNGAGARDLTTNKNFCLVLFTNYEIRKAAFGSSFEDVAMFSLKEYSLDRDGPVCYYGYKGGHDRYLVDAVRTKHDQGDRR